MIGKNNNDKSLLYDLILPNTISDESFFSETEQQLTLLSQ